MLKTLFIENYPKLILYSKIIDNFKKNITTTYSRYDYNKLAKSLNKINSSYYLYYYLFSPIKLLKLSRFNYYQLPEDNSKQAKGYMYYNSSTTSLDTVFV